MVPTESEKYWTADPKWLEWKGQVMQIMVNVDKEFIAVNTKLDKMEENISTKFDKLEERLRAAEMRVAVQTIGYSLLMSIITTLVVMGLTGRLTPVH